jgi:hypothetical protein
VASWFPAQITTHGERSLKGTLVAALFALTAFVSATLLFWVQPMIAKMILPSLGGTPAVWNTCLVFFQATLLAGYAYAHMSVRWLGARRQAWLHVAVVLLPFAVLPLTLRTTGLPPAGGNPIGWLLIVLTLSVGLPFFVLAATAPLLQRWFADVGGPGAKNPYPLYAASNLGSILALLLYPALIEPNLSLNGSNARFSQATAWAVGYAVFGVLLIACHVVAARNRRGVLAKKSLKQADLPPTMARRLLWVALAFVPSSLMIGITTYITLDIVAIPLLWVIPLCLYLLSFVITFARWPQWCRTATIVVMPFLSLPIVFIAESGIGPGIVLGTALHLLALFAVAMMCHGELAASKPSPARLTEFYLLISLGGVLGGMFNALIAPLIFPSVIEHEIAVVLACLLLPALRPAKTLFIERRFGWRPSRGRAWGFDVLVALFVGVVTLDLLVIAAGKTADESASAATTRTAVTAMAIGGPLAACVLFRNRPLRFGLGVAAVIAASQLNGPVAEPGQAVPLTIHRERSFFSVLTVDVEAAETTAESHVLMHGTTLHGQQFMHPKLRQEPLSYYSRSGPVGQVMRVIADRSAKRIALIGLGAGASACYGQRGDALDCYEIDAAVARIAGDADYFTYLTDCKARGCPVSVVLGDARLRLREAPDHVYDVLIVDAFSSDSVPIHMLTREAVELYLSKLAPDGFLLVHISNRFLNLEPVLGNIARDLNVTACFQSDDRIDLPGKRTSDWVVMTRDPASGDRLITTSPAPTPVPEGVRIAMSSPQRADSAKAQAGMPRWVLAATDARVGVWTDDYSNLFGVFRPR